MTAQTLALCVPAYNAEKFLPRLLESANRQTVKFDEIWAYDDCSTDRTAEVAEQYGASVVRGDVNQGCAIGRNSAARHSSCGWVHFHDADDELLPNFVERAREWMTHDDCDAVLFGFEEREDGTGTLWGSRVYDHQALVKDAVGYVLRQQVQSICGIYRRDVFLAAGGYDEDPETLYNEDVAMHCRMAIAGLRFAADETITVINYRRGGSMSSAHQRECFRAQYQVMLKASEALKGNYTKEVSAQLWKIAASSGSVLDWENADRCVRLASSLTGRVPISADTLFKSLCRLNPYFGMRAREYMIRLVKPHLRNRNATS